jgi:hypothetical protein
VAERVRVREIDDDEGKRLVRIVRRGTGSVVTWRRAQTVLPSAQNKKIGKSKPSEHGARIERLYAIADGEAEPREGEPEVVTCIDEFGPLNPQPRPGRTWAGISGNAKEPGRSPARGCPRPPPHRRRTAPVRRLRPGPRPALRAWSIASKRRPTSSPRRRPVPAPGKSSGT